MPLPEGFNEFEFLQDLIRRWQNRVVREEFKDLGGDEFDPDINITEHALRHACTHKDTDTSEMCMMRMYLYYFLHRKAQDLQLPVYGIPVATYQETLRYHPQIRFYFAEPEDLVEDGYEPVQRECSIRLWREDNDSITPQKARTYAERIRREFTTGRPYTWKTGRLKVCYLDKRKGYDFRILGWSESEAKELISKCMDIQEDTPDWEKLSVTESKRTFHTIPGTHYVYGKTRRKPRDRPIAYVRFRYAELKIWGIDDETLVDCTGVRRNPLITA